MPDQSHTTTDESTVLWRLLAFGREHHPPGKPYWFDNRIRQPAGTLVAQISLAGRIVLRLDGRQSVVGPGQMVLFCYGEPSSYGRPSLDEPAYECRWVNLLGSGLTDHLAAFRATHGVVLDIGPTGGLVDDMDELIAVAGPRADAPATDAAAACYRFMMHLFDHARRQHAQGLAPVERAVEHLLRHPTNPVALKELADRFGCSREHLSRVFRQRTGHTPAAYLTHVRLRHALRLITQTSLPFAAVAEQSGFTSMHTLTRQLRRWTGHPATTLRENPALAEHAHRRLARH